ncbi:MAG: winged helix-turn-helix transcriptional regulator [Anaerolineales bacterium]|nr:winged helix-turn-helix transcriptional regulator [Anaerolineales bacterium]
MINLTPTEFDMLYTMMRQLGVPFSRERLINEALGYDYAGYERTVDVHIRNLRRKIERIRQTPLYSDGLWRWLPVWWSWG